MRYILDDEGYIKDLSFDGAFTCNGKGCLLYEGDIPEGYESLDDWATNSNIRAFFISNGNLIYSEERDQYLIDLWDREIGLNDNYGIGRISNKEIILSQLLTLISIWTFHIGALFCNKKNRETVNNNFQSDANNIFEVSKLFSFFPVGNAFS